MTFQHVLRVFRSGSRERDAKRPLADHEKRPETTLDEIGLDSLDRMDTALRIEDRFGFHSNEVATTLGELWALAEGLVQSSGVKIRNVFK